MFETRRVSKVDMNIKLMYEYIKREERKGSLRLTACVQKKVDARITSLDEELYQLGQIIQEDCLHHKDFKFPAMNTIRVALNSFLADTIDSVNANNWIEISRGRKAVVPQIGEIGRGKITTCLKNGKLDFAS